MTFVAVSAGIGAAGLLYGVYNSVQQNNKADAIADANKRPTYQIPQEYKDNVAMAKQMAQIGLPSQQYNNQVNGINQNSAAAISAVNNSANPGAGLSSVLRGTNAAFGNLNAQDAAARQANQKYAIGLNTQLGQQKLAQQQYDKFDNYTENYNKEAALRGAANQNLQNGINGASQLAGNLYGLGQLGDNGWSKIQAGADKAGTLGVQNAKNTNTQLTGDFNNYLKSQNQIPQQYQLPDSSWRGMIFDPQQFNVGYNG